MKKNYEGLTKVAGFDNFRTFNGRHVVIMLAYTATSAMLYKREGKKPASVITRDGDEFTGVGEKSLISIRENSAFDFEIIVTGSDRDFHFRRDDAGNARGAVLFYAKPGYGKIHVRNICNRPGHGCADSFKITRIGDLWLLRGIYEPLLTVWNFRFNWKRYAELIFGCPIIVTDDDIFDDDNLLEEIADEDYT